MQHLAPDATAGSTAALLIRGGAVATLRFAGGTDADALQVYSAACRRARATTG